MAASEQTAPDDKSFVIALAGQPNTGKSTVFNRLTGSRQHVGNWPGKTVEQKTGNFRYAGNEYLLVDLPGTYSLTANSLEERISRSYIIEEQPDLVIAMVDASQLERSLYILSELIMLPAPVILALNMMDVAKEQERKIDVNALEKALGIKVVPMSAARNQGVKELQDAIAEMRWGRMQYNPQKPEFKEEFVLLFKDIKKKIAGIIPSSYPADWAAVKLLEGDSEVVKVVKENMQAKEWTKMEETLSHYPDGVLLAAESRYNWIKEISEKVVSLPAGTKVPLRSKFDRAATHPVWGNFIALAIMMGALMAAMVIGMPAASAGMAGISVLSGILSNIMTGMPVWLTAAVIDGLVPGLGMALAMLFFVLAVFLVIAVLEDVGYMARLSYVTDRFMQRLGLQGKAFMPLFMSFCCNVSGVMGTRVIDSGKQRLIAIILAPIIPCAAVWGVTGFISSLFFSSGAVIIVAAMLAAVVLQLVLTSILLRRYVIRSESGGLIMELPPYHKPDWKNVAAYVWVRGKEFLKRAGSLIVLVTMAIWVLSYLPNESIETSYLASLGRLLEPVGGLMGMDWRLIICLMAGFVSKEAALASMAVVLGLGEAASSLTVLLGATVEHASLGAYLMTMISPATALAFIFAMLFSVPCIGTVGAIYSESRSLTWTLGAVLYYTLTSIVAGIIAYHIGLIIF